MGGGGGAGGDGGGGSWGRGDGCGGGGHGYGDEESELCGIFLLTYSNKSPIPYKSTNLSIIIKGDLQTFNNYI